jgi:hypothetical protein
MHTIILLWDRYDPKFYIIKNITVSERQLLELMKDDLMFLEPVFLASSLSKLLRFFLFFFPFTCLCFYQPASLYLNSFSPPNWFDRSLVVFPQNKKAQPRQQKINGTLFLHKFYHYYEKNSIDNCFKINGMVFMLMVFSKLCSMNKTLSSTYWRMATASSTKCGMRPPTQSFSFALIMRIANISTTVLNSRIGDIGSTYLNYFKVCK